MVNYENNLEAHSILCSYGNQVKTSISRCGHRCTDLDIPIAGEVEENEKLKNLLNWGNSPYVMVDRKIFTLLEV